MAREVCTSLLTAATGSYIYFIEEIGLREHLSPTRSNGLVAMVKQMRLYALAYKAKHG